MNDWQKPTLEAAKEEIFQALDLLREAGGQSRDGTASERLGLVSLFLIQSVRLLEGHFMASEVPLGAWRMPIPEVPIPERAVDLLARCEEGPAHASAICKRLLFGPELYRCLNNDHDEEPGVEQIVTWLRWLRDEDSRLFSWGAAAARLDHRGTEILVELHLDELLTADEWSHPSQVLVRPRPPLSRLLGACVARIEMQGKAATDEGTSNGGSRTQLLEAQEKLERAIRIEETARKRRRNRKNKTKE